MCPHFPAARPNIAAFTLVELSIVLVIIGLVAGGVLVGQDLVRAAAVRATVTQIEKYNTAVNTFRGKYNYLPGDIKDPEASGFGLIARRPYAGQGDGNGVIEGTASGTGPACSICEQGETAIFWVDLTTARLIDDNFSAATPFGLTFAPITSTTAPSLASFLPLAKLGAGNYIYVYPSGGSNYFGISAISQLGISAAITSNPGLSVLQASAIDMKIDDGLPLTGNVIAQHLGGGGNTSLNFVGASDNSATASSATSCYDNQNSNGAIQKYSLLRNNGANINCALSFRFQ